MSSFNSEVGLLEKCRGCTKEFKPERLLKHVSSAKKCLAVYGSDMKALKRKKILLRKGDTIQEIKLKLEKSKSSITELIQKQLKKGKPSMIEQIQKQSKKGKHITIKSIEYGSILRRGKEISREKMLLQEMTGLSYSNKKLWMALHLSALAVTGLSFSEVFPFWKRKTL